tara:strand:- start:7379 stop:7918 length:540 start_codon:yes stop_codon:yes gene_type:complete
MCTPTAMITSGMQIGAGYAQGEANYRMTGLRNQAATASAKSALAIDQAILLRQTREQADRFSQRSVDRSRAAMEMASTAQTMAGEGNVGGNSVKAQQRAIAFKEGEMKVRDDKSYDSIMESIRDQNTKAVNTMVARMTSLPTPQAPSFLATALNVGASNMTGSAAESFDSWFNDTFDIT